MTRSKTFFYRKLVSVTATEATESLPALREVTVQNIGNNDCQIEFDNDIDQDTTSMTAAQGTAYTWKAGNFTTLHHKGTGVTTLLITGVRQEKA